jgi:hypothetical protein
VDSKPKAGDGTAESKPDKAKSASPGKVADMIEKMQYPDAVAKAIADDVEALGTVEKIASGELRLPSVNDAILWYRREKTK